MTNSGQNDKIDVSKSFIFRIYNMFYLRAASKSIHWLICISIFKFFSNDYDFFMRWMFSQQQQVINCAVPDWEEGSRIGERQSSLGGGACGAGTAGVWRASEAVLRFGFMVKSTTFFWKYVGSNFKMTKLLLDCMLSETIFDVKDEILRI